MKNDVFKKFRVKILLKSAEKHKRLRKIENRNASIVLNFS